MRQKEILVVMGLVFVAWMLGLFDTSNAGGDSDYSYLPSVNSFDGRIEKTRFSDHLDERRKFDTLAVSNYYTVVEVYLDSCGICRRLEAKFPAFLAERKDVVIQRVHFPDNGIRPNVTGNSREEVQAKLEEIGSFIDSYNICGTPHIEIYGPDRTLIARDECSSKKGLAYLRDWMSDEINIPVSAI